MDAFLSTSQMAGTIGWSGTIRAQGLDFMDACVKGVSKKAVGSIARLMAFRGANWHM